jgi:trk system potassium uptake protein TrkA
MNTRFAVIGLGQFGARLAELLTQSGAEVIAIDRDRDAVEAIRDHVTVAVRLDSTDEQAMRLQGVDQVGAAIVGIGTDFESAILTVSVLRSFHIQRIVCRAETERQGRILTQVGADTIVRPEAEAAVRWSERLMLPDLKDVVELGEGHTLIQVLSPEQFQHRTPGELQLRQSHRVNLVAIKRVVSVRDPDSGREDTRHTLTIPGPDTKILPTDVLVLVGSNESLDQLLHR